MRRAVKQFLTVVLSFPCLLSSPKAVLAFPDGAPNCISGRSSALHGRTTGTLQQGNFEVRLGGATIADETTVAPGTYQIVVQATDGTPLRGILLRMEGGGNFDLTPGSILQNADGCVNTVQGVTHTESSRKSRIEATVDFRGVGTVALDATLVVSNSFPLGNVHYYSRYTIFVESPTSPVAPTPVASPISSRPTASPSTDPTTANPTARPSISPSVNPSGEPSATATANPSAAPFSGGPTVSPSTDPTTANPTARPSISPSVNPSGEPSATATANPSAAPFSDGPTVSPSMDPSANPFGGSPTSDGEDEATEAVSPTIAPFSPAPLVRPTLDPTTFFSSPPLLSLPPTTERPTREQFPATIVPHSDHTTTRPSKGESPLGSHATAVSGFAWTIAFTVQYCLL